MKNEKVMIIEFPNTSVETEIYTSKEYEIKRIYKDGEMAKICWFEVRKEGEVVAEIKESICNIYYS